MMNLAVISIYDQYKGCNWALTKQVLLKQEYLPVYDSIKFLSSERREVP